MNSAERADIQRIAPAIRAARKSIGLTQIEMAKKLGISQGAISKIESAQFIPSATLWLEFSDIVNVDPVATFRTGFVDRGSSVVIDSNDREGSFRIPKRYSNHRASKVREILPFIRFGSMILGEKAMMEFIRLAGIDPDFFHVLDHQLNICFMIDLVDFLDSKGALSKNNIPKLADFYMDPVLNRRLQKEVAQANSVRDVFQRLVEGMGLYEANFQYLVKETENRGLAISVSRGKHLDDLKFDDRKLKEILPEIKRSWIQNFAASNDQAKSIRVEYLSASQSDQNCGSFSIAVSAA